MKLIRNSIMCSFFFLFITSLVAQNELQNNKNYQELVLHIDQSELRNNYMKLSLTINGFDRKKHQASIHKSTGEPIQKVEDRKVELNEFEEGSYLLVLERFASYSVITTREIKQFKE